MIQSAQLFGHYRGVIECMFDHIPIFIGSLK